MNIITKYKTEQGDCPLDDFIEELIKSSNSRTVSLVDLIPHLKKKFPKINVFSFYLEVPIGAFSMVIDSVSREIMDILLEIDDKIGNIDDLESLRNLGQLYVWWSGLAFGFQEEEGP